MEKLRESSLLLYRELMMMMNADTGHQPLSENLREQYSTYPLLLSYAISGSNMQMPVDSIGF
jgi:hypothetical protein